MEQSVSRLVLAGTNSGCGKTTVSCAILQALVNRGLRVGAFKCGPDYIDPMFHSSVIGAKSSNLDPYFFTPNTLRFLLGKNGADRDVSIIEGVMGLYDGLTMDSSRASTYEVAQWTKSPVVLVVNAKGAARSVLATIQGFLSFEPENTIAGVILNGCTAMTYSMLAPAISARFGGEIKPLGYLPQMKDASLESRHLGLITAQEVENLKEKLNLLAAQAEKSLDLGGLLNLAASAPPVESAPVIFPRKEPVRIAVSRDRAFCFTYADSLDALREMGAELVPFSPLEDEALPENIHGLYLCGGYPELYAESLSNNKSMLASVRSAIDRGLPTIAECGGFQYLTEQLAGHPMVGIISGESFDAGRLVRFGYVRITAKADNLLCRAGESIAAHEFHRWDSQNPGSGFEARKESGRTWQAIHAGPRLYAGYPHFHFYSNPHFAERFYDTCLEVKHHD